MLADHYESTPPFRDSRHRIHRRCDDRFAAYMNGNGSVTVRIVGNRRTGKTSLVLAYAAKTKAALLTVAVPPPPADASPTAVFSRALDDRIATLAKGSNRKAARWHAAFKKLQARRTEGNDDQSKTGTIASSLGVAGLELSGARTRKSNNPGAQAQRPSANISAFAHAATTLDLLDAAAGSINERPIVFLDGIQHLLLVAARAEADALVWSLRNVMQNHRNCRYVLAGSNRRLFDLLQVGQSAPFLHMGSALEIPPFTTEEIDEWALPLLRDLGGRHVRSLEQITALLCGKIGEIIPVLERLWTDTSHGDVLDESAQHSAVDGVIAATNTLDSALVDLARTQAALLRHIVTRPGAGLYSNEAKASISGGSPGTISTALAALVERGFVEAYGKNEVRAAAPLLALAIFRGATPADLEPRLLRKEKTPCRNATAGRHGNWKRDGRE